MSLDLKFAAKVEKGRIRFDAARAFLNHIRSLEGKAVEIILRPFRRYKPRSNNQNRYYWGVILKILAEETGHTDEEIHDVLKGMFLYRHILMKGIPVKTTRSTSEMNTTEMEDYFKKICLWAAQSLKIYIPPPNEVPFEY